jgi:hypothetical protein
MIEFIATSNGADWHSVKAIQLFVVVDNRLRDNLHASVETVGSNPMSQMRLAGRRIYGHCRARQLVM